MTPEVQCLSVAILLFALFGSWVIMNPYEMLPSLKKDKPFHYLIVGYWDPYKRDFVWEMGYGHWTQAKQIVDDWGEKGTHRGNYITNVRYVRVSRWHWYFHAIFQPMSPDRVYFE